MHDIALVQHPMNDLHAHLCLPPRLEDALPQPLERQLCVLLGRERERHAHERRYAAVGQETDARNGEDALLHGRRRDERRRVARGAVLGQVQVEEQLRARRRASASRSVERTNERAAEGESRRTNMPASGLTQVANPSRYRCATRSNMSRLAM